VLVQDDGTRYYTPSSNRINLRGSGGPYQYQDPAFYFDTLDQGFAVELGVPSFRRRRIYSGCHWTTSSLDPPSMLPFSCA
jgi:hypothetical protein